MTAAVRRAWLLALVGCGRLKFASQPDAPGGGDGGTLPDTSTLGACTKLALADNFDDGMRDPAWMLLQNNPVVVVETGGQLSVTLATAGGSHYGGYDSLAPFDMRDHCMWVSYIATPTNEAFVEMTFGLRDPPSTIATGFVYHLGVIDPFSNNGTFTSYGAVPFNPTAHKILRLREDSGTLTWQTSADGVVFATLASAPTPVDVSNMLVILESGTFGSAPSPGTAVYDNFNSP